MMLVPDSTPCVICAKSLGGGANIVSFPAFVANRLDPLYLFSDAACHASCFDRHPLAQQAQDRYEEFRDRTPPRNVSCTACRERILNPDEYIGLGHLTADDTKAAFRYNYSQFHRRCIASWPELSRAKAALDALEASGEWDQSDLHKIAGLLRMTD